jgi:hypothetical protein
VDERIGLTTVLFKKNDLTQNLIFVELAVWGPGCDRVEVYNGSFKASNRRRRAGPLNANAESTTDDVDKRIGLSTGLLC